MAFARQNRTVHSKKAFKFSTFVLMIVCYIVSDLLVGVVEADELRPDKVLELTSDNYDENTSKFQIVVLNFYADWCPYSARWKPVFHESAKLIYEETVTNSSNPNAVVFGQINCEIQTTLAQRFRITKFPTTKLTLGGKPCKKEYRGARTSAAFKEYIRKFLKDPLIYVKDSQDLHSKAEEKKGAFIMYSNRQNEMQLEKPIETNELQVFRRIAQQLREDCQFLFTPSYSGKVSQPDSYTIEFKPQHKSYGLENIQFTSSILDQETLSNWAKEQCIPLVREITFDNAEELTEEGLPFVILFYDPSDKSWIDIYKKVVEHELKSEATGVTFLYADGFVFAHPLKHLGKTEKDLPLIAIDSFKHLFLYRDHVNTITQPGKLKQFIADLHSGKLDLEFHFGRGFISPETRKSPPESAFNKLTPSASRYSILPRDEL